MRRSHYRRSADYIPRPRCAHHRAIWDAYEAASTAYYDRKYDRTEAFSAPLGDPPERPDGDAIGYCADCQTDLFSGRPWTAEEWAYFNHDAAIHAHPVLKPITFPTLPPDPRARTCRPATWRELAIKAYAPTKDQRTDQQITRVIGRSIGTDEGGRPYAITTTNGYCLIAEPGQGTGDPVSSYLSIKAGGPWIDLPAAFQLALNRVRLLANERSEAIYLTIGPDRTLILQGRSVEYGEATETIGPLTISQAPIPEAFTCCLSAEYLDALAGCWPVRWYLRAPIERTDPPSRFSPDPKPYRIDQAQLFSPAGTAARVLIMPLRID